MFSADFNASSRFVAVEFTGCFSDNLSTSFLNFSLSSATSIASGDVPIIFTLSDFNLLASFSGV